MLLWKRDEGSNSLIVAASAENMEVVRELVELLVDAEQERSGDHTFEIIPVSRNRARDLVQLIEDLYVDGEQRRRGRQSSSRSRRTTASMRFSRVERQRISRPFAIWWNGLMGQRPGSVRRGSLCAACFGERPGDGQPDRERACEGTPHGGSRDQIGAVLRYLQQTEGGEDVEVEVSSAIRDSIALTPDVRTNTVIVTAPHESMGLIVRMIEDLDQSSTGAKKIEVFKLVNADAKATAKASDGSLPTASTGKPLRPEAAGRPCNGCFGRG